MELWAPVSVYGIKLSYINVYRKYFFSYLRRVENHKLRLYIKKGRYTHKTEDCESEQDETIVEDYKFSLNIIPPKLGDYIPFENEVEFEKEGKKIKFWKIT